MVLNFSDRESERGRAWEILGDVKAVGFTEAGGPAFPYSSEKSKS